MKLRPAWLRSVVAAVVGVIVAVLVWPWLGVAAIAAGWVGFCLTFCVRTLTALWPFTTSLAQTTCAANVPTDRTRTDGERPARRPPAGD